MPGIIINNVRPFQEFHRDWIVRLEHLLHELLTAQETLDEDADFHEIRALVSRVLAHYQEYFEEKSRMAKRDVFLVFSPNWFTPLEKSFLWIGGFKPGLAFNLVMGSVDDLSEAQFIDLDLLKAHTRNEENQLVQELARIQETVAAPPLAVLARRDPGAPPGGGGARGVDEILDTLRTEMEDLMIEADKLRARTAEEVVGVLAPMQKVSFLAAAAQLQLRIRNLGIEKEAESRRQPVANGW